MKPDKLSREMKPDKNSHDIIAQVFFALALIGAATVGFAVVVAVITLTEWLLY